MKFEWLNKTDKPYILGHRGVMGLYPENTLLSFEKAIEMKVDAIELDVHLSSDKKLVVIHDEFLDRTTTGTGYIKDLTASDIKKADAGIKFDKKYEGLQVPLLEEVLELLKDTRLGLNIEIKNGPVFYKNIENEVIKLIDRYRFKERTLISSFDHSVLKRIKDIDKKIKTGILCSSYIVRPVKYLKKIKADGINPRWNYVTKNLIRKMHKNGFFVVTWVINDKKRFDKLKKWKIDTVGTNNPSCLS